MEVKRDSGEEIHNYTAAEITLALLLLSPVYETPL